MTIRHLKIFLSVYETGSTAAAGRELRVAQPSVSVALGELEDYYKIRLFERYGRRLLVTDAGRSFYQYARHVVDLFEEMEDNARHLSVDSTLRIGSSITIGTYFLPQYITAFQRTHPGTRVQVVVENTGTITQYLLSNQIDLALVEGAIAHPFLIARPYRQDRLVLVCHPGHPFAAAAAVTAEMVQAQPLLLREPGSAVRELVDTLMEGRGLVVDPVWQSVSTQAIIRAVKAGLGLSILPYYLVKDHLDRGELATAAVEGMDFQRSYAVVFHKNKFHFPAMDDFIALCR